MMHKLVEAIQVFTGNVVLLATLVLTVWLPGNVLLNYLASWFMCNSVWWSSSSS